MSHPVETRVEFSSKFVANSHPASSKGDDTASMSASSEASSHADGTNIADGPSVYLTAKCFVLTLLLTGAIAFSVGTISRNILLSTMGMTPLMYPQHISTAASHTIEADQGMSMKKKTQPPNLKEFDGKGVGVPSTTAFITHMFQQKATARENPEDEEDSEDDDGQDKNDMDGNRLPAGQHLRVDMKHVDSLFLNSEERIAQAMLGLIEESKATLLSYHCHTLVPMGVSCIGVLLQSHVSIHTWPTEGIALIDLFTGSIEPLVPILPIIKRLFTIPSQELVRENAAESPETTMLWSQTIRGFPQGFSDYNPYENPVEQDFLILMGDCDFDMKVSLLSEETAFQQVDIVTLINPRLNSLGAYQRSMSSDGSYESLHPDLYRPDKILFLDGVQQSSLLGEAAYHEALVHPSMIAHQNPKRVAIIGGGEGGTLREVLKHNTVEEVMMVEIDGKLVEMCREFLPEWSNCTDFVGSDADSCFDDSRASVAFADAFGWFIDNFGDRAESKAGKFDVIIMDALDPDQFVAIVGSLYKDDIFVESLFNGLSEEGVFVVQMGEADHNHNPADEVGPKKDKVHMMEALEHAGFESMHIYDEGHSHFEAPWSYLVCFKDSKSRARWYKTAAEIDIELHQRLHRTKSGKSILNYFSASAMLKYQLPSKAQETIFCRKASKLSECEIEYRGINPELVDPISQLEARKSTVAEYSGEGLSDTVFSPLVERHLRQILAVGASSVSMRT